MVKRNFIGVVFAASVVFYAIPVAVVWVASVAGSDGYETY